MILSEAYTDYSILSIHTHGYIQDVFERGRIRGVRCFKTLTYVCFQFEFYFAKGKYMKIPELQMSSGISRTDLMYHPSSNGTKVVFISC